MAQNKISPDRKIPPKSSHCAARAHFFVSKCQNVVGGYFYGPIVAYLFLKIPNGRAAGGYLVEARGCLSP